MADIQEVLEHFPPVFEGPEKVLEVWFVNPAEYEDGNATSTPTRNLLDISREDWVTMLDLVHCQVLSVIEHGDARAYLLSESSMFVYPYQIVLKTCGTTTLLKCISRLLELSATVGLTKVDNVFYNRQNFFFPDKQLEPHQGFKGECRILDSYFNNGGAYIVGKVNENHYNFYNAECRMSRDDPLMQERDSTLEILMTGLNQEQMKYFHFNPELAANNQDNAKMRQLAGIDKYFPGAKIDDYMFEPFGYSLNGLTDEGYFTIHVTPQENCSFASFETNIYREDYTELIQNVLRTFGPERLILTHLANSLVVKHLQTKPTVDREIINRGFDTTAINNNFNLKIVDDIYCRFDHYDLFFVQFNAISHPKLFCITSPKGTALAAPSDNNSITDNTNASIDHICDQLSSTSIISEDDDTRRRKDPNGSILKPNSPFHTAKKAPTDELPAFDLQ